MWVSRGDVVVCVSGERVFGFVDGVWFDEIEIDPTEKWVSAPIKQVKKLLKAEHERRGLFEDTLLEEDACGRKNGVSFWINNGAPFEYRIRTNFDSSNVNGCTFNIRTGKWAKPLVGELKRPIIKHEF